MLRPAFLHQGDKVALISPAGTIDEIYVKNAVETLRSWGLNPIVGKNALNRYGYYAGTDDERIDDLQWAMDDDEIHAIFCTRGGYGCMRIAERMDYSKLQGAPKWLVGFSDITVLHTMLNSLGIESLHAPMPKSFGDTSEDAMNRLRGFLFGDIVNYRFDAHPLNRKGFVESNLVGGNLSLIHCTRSTSIECPQTRKSILFIEDVGENLYAVDRMMQSLKLSGSLTHLRGLIVGGFSKMGGENFGKTAYEIIREAVDDFDYPVAFGFSAGHIADNYPIILGADVALDVNAEYSELIFL